MLKRLAVGALLAFAVDPFLHAEAGSWKPLFNGKNLSGWKHVGAGEMVVEDRPGKPGPEWNTMEITQGQPVPPRKFSYEPQRGPRPDDGYIGLQNHGKHDVVLYKEIAVRPLER